MSPAILSIIIFAICVVLFIWNKLPISVTALIGLTAMILFNLVSFSQGFKNFGSSTIVLICGMMVVGQAAFETGLAQVIGVRVIGLAHGSERASIVIATAMTAVISAFLSNVAILAIMIAIFTGICAGNKRIHFMNVVLPVSIASAVGGAATLVGSTTQLVAHGIVEEYFGSGSGFSFSTFIIPGSIIIVALVLYVAFVGYPLGKKIWGHRPEYNSVMTIDENAKMPTPDVKKMRIMAVIFIATVMMFVGCEWITKFIPNFSIAIVAIIAAVACVLTGCISHTKAISSINWTLVIWLCSSLGIAAGLNESGGGQLMATWFIGLFGENISPFNLFCGFLFLVTFLTQFLSNATVLAMVLPMVFSLTTEMNLNAYSFAVGLAMAAGMSIATPLSSTTSGMAMVANYHFVDHVIYAGPIALIALIILMFLTPILWPLV